MGRPELLVDPRFTDNEKRVANGAALTEIIEHWLQSLPSVEEALRILEEHHIPAGPILSVEEAMAQQHMRERGTVRKISDPILGEFNVPGFPMKFSRNLPAPFLGEHNADILMQQLGYTLEQVRTLEADGVLCREARGGAQD